MAMTVETYVALGLDQAAPREVNGRSVFDILGSIDHAGDAPYHPCPEASPDASAATGTTTKHADWEIEGQTMLQNGGAQG